MRSFFIDENGLDGLVGFLTIPMSDDPDTNGADRGVLGSLGVLADGAVSASPSAVHHLNVNNNEITSELDIANTFGHTFSSNSSSEHYTDAFNAHRQRVEKQPLKFKSNNNEAYNCLFCLQELTAAIEKSSDSAVSPDDVHYQMLKHLPQSALLTLLHIINKLWSSESFPSTWQQAVVLPIPKIDKDKSCLLYTSDAADE